VLCFSGGVWETSVGVKEHAMPAFELAKRYKSPIHKLLRFFERSRDRWKAKCQAAKARVKRLQSHTAKLLGSRQRWKELAQQRAREIEELRRELETLKT